MLSPPPLCPSGVNAFPPIHVPLNRDRHSTCFHPYSTGAETPEGSLLHSLGRARRDSPHPRSRPYPVAPEDPPDDPRRTAPDAAWESGMKNHEQEHQG